MLSKYSHSALGTYRNCPRKFAFAYIEKPDITKPVTADAYMGNAVHRTLRELYHTVTYGKVLSFEQLAAIYDRQWETEEQRHITVINQNLGVDDYIRAGRDMLKVYYDRYQPFDQGKTLALESNLRFTLPGTPFNFSATVDRLWRRDDGVVEIADYKTGSYLPKGGRDPAFYYQMGIYQLAVQENYPDFGEIETAQYFLRMNEVIRYRFSPDEIDGLVAELRDTVAETIHAARLNDFPTNEGGLCDYCEYFDVCPAKRHRILLEREAGGEQGEEITTAESAARLTGNFLKIDRELKELKKEHEALKGDLVQAARDLGVDRLTSDGGNVKITSAIRERLISRSTDPSAFADLVFLVRDLGLDDYLEPNTNAIMKEVYRKGRLTDEQEEKLREFIIQKEEFRVTPRHTDPEDDGGE